MLWQSERLLIDQVHLALGCSQCSAFGIHLAGVSGKICGRQTPDDMTKLMGYWTGAGFKVLLVGTNGRSARLYCGYMRGDAEDMWTEVAKALELQDSFTDRWFGPGNPYSDDSDDDDLAG